MNVAEGVSVNSIWVVLWAATVSATAVWIAVSVLALPQAEKNKPIVVNVTSIKYFRDLNIFFLSFMEKIILLNNNA
ncbi:hypothetical protein B4Q13_23020, partial [Lacticaseibacillus rhamnosus]